MHVDRAAEGGDVTGAINMCTGVVVEIPMPVPSASNLREHWAKKGRRARQQRNTTKLVLARFDPRIALPCFVRLTRVAPRKLDDDNLRGALKNCRDGVADWLGIDDGSKDIRWEYEQEKGKPKYQAVRIEVYA